MWFYKRILSSLLIIWGSSTLVFFLLRVLPGDPAELLLGDFFNEEEILELSQSLNLHLPLIQQYLIYLKDLMSGDWGLSFIRQESVWSLIVQTFPNTIVLAFSIFSVAFVLSFFICFFWLRSKSPPWDTFFSFGTMIMMCMPVFVLAPYGMKVFSVDWALLPVGGSGSWKHLLLPALCSGFLSSGIMSRTLHRRMVEELSKEYIRTAKSKGLSPWDIFIKHALKNSANSFLTLCSFVLLNLLTGSLLIEILFDYPGIGRLLFEAYMSRDLPLIQGLVLFLSFLYIVIHLLNDLVYAWMDPRVKLS